jgi:hypothetical protein
VQRAAAENVDVQVGNALAPVRTVIDDDAEALGQLETGGELTRCEEQVTEQGLVAGLSQTEPIDAAFRDYEHMHRRLGIDVMNGDALVVLVLDEGKTERVGLRLSYRRSRLSDVERGTRVAASSRMNVRDSS